MFRRIHQTNRQTDRRGSPSHNVHLLRRRQS